MTVLGSKRNGELASPQAQELRVGSSDAELTRVLLEGGVGKQFGLTLPQLRLGLDVARHQLQRGAFNEAIRLYATLVLCAPTEVDFQVGLANCALKMDTPALALQAASAVIALAPRDSRGYLLSARACIALGQPVEAKEDLDDAVRFGQAERNAEIVAEARRLLLSLEANTEDRHG